MQRGGSSDGARRSRPASPSRASSCELAARQTEHDSEGDGDDCTGRTFIFCSSWEEAPAHIDLLFPFVYPFGPLSLRTSRRPPARANPRDRLHSIWEPASMHSLPLERVNETTFGVRLRKWMVACQGVRLRGPGGGFVALSVPRHGRAGGRRRWRRVGPETSHLANVGSSRLVLCRVA